MRRTWLRSSFAFLIASLFTLPVAQAQTGTIVGTVTDSSSGESLPGVNVVIPGTQQGASTDADGNYVIDGVTPGTYEVRASFVGYGDEVEPGVSVSADETTRVDFALVLSEVRLDEVVAVGYGTQRTEEITGSVGGATSEEFLEGTARDAGELIEGQIAGLNVSQSSGDPTGGSQIRLRGTTTLFASSSPLVLIDGVPGNLNTVSPNEIASVDVLKGGSAAAIYGSRASNGVILITSKEQQTGERTRIEYNANVSYDQINNRPDFYEAEDIRRLQQEFPQDEYPNLPLQNVNDYGHGTDWQEEVLREPVSYTQGLAVSGGEANTNYRASVNYENQEGIFLRSDNQDAFGRIRVNHSMFDDALRADANVAARIRTYWSGVENGSFNTNVWRQALTRNPTDRIRNDEGQWQERSGDNYSNPLALVHETHGTTENRELRLNGTLTWSPVQNLELSLLGANNRWTQTRGYSETFQHVSTTKQGLDGYASRTTASTNEELLEITGTYNDRIGAHNFDVLGGYSWQENESEDFFMSNDHFPTDEFRYHAMETGRALPDGEATMDSGSEAWRLIGFFGRLNYNYDNRYILQGSVRYEGNSKFGANHKWGLFPAVSAGWRINEESFMDDVTFVNALKVRGGFGVTGIAPEDPYQSLASYQYGGSFFNNGEWVQGLEPARNPNPELRWERKEEINLGLDFSVLGNRVSGSVDVYRRTTKDLLFDYSVPVPPFLFNTITANVGEMRNEGIEAALDFAIVENANLHWSTNTNFSTNRNELLRLSNDQFQTENNFFDQGFIGGPVQQPTHRIQVGGPIGNFWGFKAVGVNEDGIWQIEGQDGNIKPWTEKVFEDKQVLGNGVPNYTISWNHTVRYGNFDARLAMGGEFDYQVLNITRLFYETPGNNSHNWLEGAYEEVEGQLLRNREAWVSHYLEDGDYWKIESFSLGYTVSSLFDVVSNARIYVTGRNLATFTGYSGIDPEVNTADLTPGVDSRFKFPTTRTYTVGLNLTF